MRVGLNVAENFKVMGDRRVNEVNENSSGDAFARINDGCRGMAARS